MKIDSYVLNIPDLYTSMCPLHWNERSAVHPLGGAAQSKKKSNTQTTTNIATIPGQFPPCILQLVTLCLSDVTETR